LVKSYCIRRIYKMGKIHRIILSLAVLTASCLLASPAYSGGTDGTWDQLHVAVFSESGGAVDAQIGADDGTYTVASGSKLFVVIQADFSIQSKDQDIEIMWRAWAGTFAVASPKNTGSATAWEFWNSNYASLDTRTIHFTLSNGAVYLEDETTDAGDPLDEEEFWFVVEAPTTDGRYELAISEDGVVTGIQGTISQVLDITVGTPPAVSTQAASSIGDNSATLNGNITATGTTNVTERGFDWGFTDSYGSSWTETPGPYGTGTYNHGISGLDSATTYHFRAKAYNSYGWSYGADTEFTTTGLPTKPYLRVVQGNPRKGSATWWEWIVVNPTDSTITVTEVRVVDDAATDWGWTADNTQGYPTSGWTDGGVNGYYWSGSETVPAYSAKVFRSRPAQASATDSTSHTMTWSCAVTGYSPAQRQTQVW
jgi:hypothetical protein